MTGFLGGSRGTWIEQELIREEIPFEKTQIAGESRTCLILLDQKRKRTTVINEPGAVVSSDEFGTWFRLYTDKLLSKAEAVILAGSFPPGVSAPAAREIIEAAGHRNKLTFLDTSGEALADGLKARPFLVKINRFEAESLLGYAIADTAGAKEAVGALIEEGVSMAVVTLGKKGAVIGSKKETYSLTPPKAAGWIDVGAGDAMMAGLVHAVRRGLPMLEAGKFAVATAACGFRYGFGRLQKADVDLLLSRVNAGF